MHVKITKTQRIEDRSVTDITELKGDANEVLGFLDELGFTTPVDEEAETVSVH